MDDDIALDYWKLPNGNYIEKFKKDDGLDGENDVKNPSPSHLGAFVSSNSKRFMNNFFCGAYNLSIYYGDTDSLYIERKSWDVLDKAVLIGSNLCQGKNDLKSGFLFCGIFLAPKRKYCLTIKEIGITEEQKFFKGFNDSKRLLDRCQNFNMIDGKKTSAMLPKSLKKSFFNGVIIPAKMGFCNECIDKIICDK